MLTENSGKKVKLILATHLTVELKLFYINYVLSLTFIWILRTLNLSEYFCRLRNLISSHKILFEI